MNTLTQAILAAVLAAAGITMIIAYLLPAQPALREALARLSGQAPADPFTIDADAAPETRLQAWTLRTGRRAIPLLARQHWLKIPANDLAILHRSTARWLGDKILSAAVGLIAPTVINLAAATANIGLSWQIPALAGIAAAVALFFAPDIEVRRRAAAAREEFRRALGAYVELAAMARNAGVGVTQSLEIAATVANTWVFGRISYALNEAAYSGRNAWTALETIAVDLDINELHAVSDIMAQSGLHGTSVYTQLRSAAANMRNERLSAEQGDARSATQKMSAPLAGLAVLFFILLLLPALHNIVNG